MTTIRAIMSRILFALALVSCGPERVLYCNHTCVADNVSVTAAICDDTPRAAPECQDVSTRQPARLEEVSVVGFDPNDVETEIELKGYITTVTDDGFELDITMRTGFLGAGVYALSDGALLGIVEDSGIFIECSKIGGY